MDSRVVQSQEHVGSQGDEHQHDHEKKSVLKKVKEKARKIKDTIKKHGLHDDHENVHDYHYDDQHIRHDDHDLNEEDNEREEMLAKTSQVHGAPIYYSATAESTFPAQVENQGHPKVNHESTSLMEDEVHHREPRKVVVTPTTESDQNRVTEPARTFVEQEVNLERPIDLEEDPHAPGSRPEAYTPSNYGTKVTDPTGEGTREIDISPVQDSLARMNVQDEEKANPEARVLPITGETQCPTIQSHDDQFSSEIFSPNKLSENLQAEPNISEYPSITSHDQIASESIPTNSYKFSENLQAEPEISSLAKTQYPSSEPIPTFSSETPTVLSSHDQFSPEATPAVTTSNYETLYPSAGSHDQFCPEFVPSKLEGNPQGIGEMMNTATTTTRVAEQPYSESTEKPPNQNNFTEIADNEEYRIEEKPSNQTSYTEKISNATSEISDKAVSAKNVVSSKLGYEENPSENSSYTEKISNATSAIADKAVSAKNALASKLGYDEKGDNEESQTRHNEEYITGEKPSNQSSYTQKISSATSAIADKAVSAKDAIADDDKETTSEVHESGEFAQKIALSLTEELSPVYKNVSETGIHDASNKSTTNGTESGVSVQDKGVSVKDYLAEKLRPGDDDKALKDVISDTLNKQKDEPVNEDRSMMHKQEEEHQNLDNMNSPRKGMVDKLKTVVGSWFGKPGEDHNQSSQVAGGESYVSQNVEGRTIQEST